MTFKIDSTTIKDLGDYQHVFNPPPASAEGAAKNTFPGVGQWFPTAPAGMPADLVVEAKCIGEQVISQGMTDDTARRKAINALNTLHRTWRALAKAGAEHTVTIHGYRYSGMVLMDCVPAGPINGLGKLVSGSTTFRVMRSYRFVFCQTTITEPTEAS